MDVEKELSALKARVDELPGAENKLSMVVFSGDLDKQIAAMIIATGAAAMGMKVVMFFTFWATAALRDPAKKVSGKNLMGKMFGFMLPKGRNNLKLSQMHMAGAGTAMIKSLMKKKNVASMDQLYEIAAMLGIEFKICEMSMDLMEMKREEMIEYPNMEYCGVATFLANAKESAVQLFI
ncbi:MAG: DsrE/DsrF/DrsH-like family protein [Eubacteriales bacterium]|nr:DsrE/DsrF/DrsH-like family protein [Eubacteriales bacterium]